MATKLRNWLSSANKLVLAAVGAGVAGIITTGVVTLPHLLAAMFSTTTPLTVQGGASPGLQPSDTAGGVLNGIAPDTDPCSLAGEYVVPGNIDPHGTITTNDVANLLKNAGDASETKGSYVLEGNAGQTAVLTGIHTVLLRRIPVGAAAATVVTVETRCVGATPILYDASIDLDAADLTPKLTQYNELGGAGANVTQLGTVIAQDEPVKIDFDAATAKFDVTWQLRFDYTVGGKAYSTTEPSASQPFQTDAIGSDDSWLTLTLSPDGATWSASALTAEQKHAKELADDLDAVAGDYSSLGTGRSGLESSLAALKPMYTNDLNETLQAEQHVLGEAGRVDNHTVCADASTVAHDADKVARDAQTWATANLGSVGDSEDDGITGWLLAVSDDTSALDSDLQDLLQIEPGFNGEGSTPSPAQVRQAISTALAATAKDVSTVNALADRVNGDVAAAYAYATTAYAAGQQCMAPSAIPSPIAHVNQQGMTD